MAEPTEEGEYRHHQKDEETTWFALDRDARGEPVLAEYRRYAAVMMQTSELGSKTRYPSLVSFVGQTGAGKSTLINLLIDLKSDPRMANDDPAKMAPVIGRSSCTLPTSADVHLYISPETRFSKRPILYADCEGFEGGERSPIAITALSPETKDPSSSGNGSRRPDVLRKMSQGTQRLLKWASHNSQAYEQTSKRAYAVSEMYPRIFYAFSDIIVFVLDNPNTLEVVVERLLEWADANYSRSINQPTKPHAIVALNKSNPKTPEDQWNTVNATAHLLTTASAKIDENKTFVRYAKMRKKASLSRIDNMHDLLRCYYSTVHVVRIPEKSRYHKLDQQRRQLLQVIEDCCTIAFKDKQEREMLTDVDDFGLYLSLAFDHFSETLDKPFDFIEASLKRNPLSASFADNVLAFARRMAVHKNCEGQIVELFAYLTPFVASCILLESARKKRIGRPEDWFGDLEDDEPAILKYFHNDVQCNFAIYDPFALKKRPCELRYLRHGHSHRAKTKLRTIEAPGNFELSFEMDQITAWEEDILAQLVDMHDKSRRKLTFETRQATLQAHSKLLQSIYRGGYPTRDKAAEFQLNSICVACLCNPPQHQLGCGHILCTDCVKDFGQQDGRSVKILGCPLHDNFQKNSPTGITTDVELAPAFSGLRVLTLDGGGIRGIVELAVLKAIEACLGVPLQKFFDLVVGTSTGGIIALGFGHEMWSVDHCTQQFQKLVQPAFSKRKGQDVHVIREVQLFVKHSKYETTPLETQLKQAFGDRTLFPKHRSEDRLKTAVIAVSSSGSRAWVLSNYNTHPGRGRGPPYQRYRPSRPRDEILTWEAARSTSAAPGFFKPFSPHRAGSKLEEWIDGAVLHNNPVQIAIEEARRIAEMEQLNGEPDVVLSIGTGLSKRVRHLGDIPSEEIHLGAPKARTTGWIRSLFTMVSYQIKLNTDADRRWASVLDTERHISGQLYRINPDLQMDPPELDAVDKVEELAKLLPRLLIEDGSLQGRIQEVACALVASSFFFEKDGRAVSTSSSSTEIRGWICCRLGHAKKRAGSDSVRGWMATPTQPITSLRGNKDDIRQLGKFVARSVRPEFIIYNEPKNDKDVFLSIPVDEMMQQGEFSKQGAHLTVPGDDTVTTMALRLPGICGGRAEFPISGFPRQLMKMDFNPSYRHDGP
ncbi:hypothetical protein G647_04120 [Cladophialophora carrionii CBS 160.54]|uniref:PNPLA domain-containing protein n=1 Tax=Cladophialophora carrionii CBS 160.54 TaxID=1279043 RepID=V9DD19_9EURO|nr:uncharacterized protein G647_04120 [Cladophialophora carrionii CBS 160.54]ETI24750.1 hypothetical protein G647_04120 [Cladophialophora carrionii CBS 160.54]